MVDRKIKIEEFLDAEALESLLKKKMYRGITIKPNSLNFIEGLNDHEFDFDLAKKVKDILKQS